MFSEPNYTQTPNEFFDSLAKTLKEGELRCVLVFMRQMFGWRKKGDRISITQLMDKTGMERKAVINSVKSLVQKKIIIKNKVGPPGKEAVWYSFAVTQEPEEPDYSPEDENGNPIDDSNNSYRYPKDTGGGILKIPTKETNTKEIYPPTPPKGGKSPPKIGRAPHVETTETEHENLAKKYGPEIRDRAYSFLSAWKEEKIKKRKGGDDNRKIHNWVIAAVLEKEKRDKFVEKELGKTQKKKQEFKTNIPDWMKDDEDV